MMIAEEQFKELMRLTEKIKREETKDEDLRMIETTRTRFHQLNRELTTQIKKMISLRKIVRAVLEDL